MLRAEDFLRVGKAKQLLSVLVYSILTFPNNQPVPVKYKNAVKDEFEFEKIWQEIRHSHLVSFDVLRSLRRCDITWDAQGTIRCLISMVCVTSAWEECTNTFERAAYRTAWLIVEELAAQYKL